MQFNPNDRQILVLTGQLTEALTYAKRICCELDYLEFHYPKKAQGYLGQEFDAIIFNMHEAFDPNAFGALTGTIRGGGFLILLRPNKLQRNSLFLNRFNQILEQKNPNIHFLKMDNQDGLLLPKPPRNDISQAYASSDQEKGVSAIIKVITGHRRRPLIITSDRGRGKSATLGIAAKELAKQNVDNIIICAPSKKTAAMVFKHAEQDLDIKNNSNLTFYSPDELKRQKPKADLVLIDEAAAIPVPLLTEFLQRYSRIVFASTQHGYEGSGRGFAINFCKVLDRETPQWKHLKLKTPVRWNENDSLEQFTFDALLLNAEAADEALIKTTVINDCHFTKIIKKDLLENNDKLRQLFGLLVSAHYQTKPSDLMQLLDDDSVTIFCLEANEAIVGVALLISEGNIDSELHADIFSGTRRIQGHLVAQALSSNIGIESAPKLLGERISRIAIHPSLQNKGFGTYLINQLQERSTADYLSTCYGATDALLNFWKKLAFEVVHLGIKRDASSGSHSVTMVYPKTHDGIKLCKQAKTNFTHNFNHLISDSFAYLETEIVFLLLPKRSRSITHNDDLKQLTAFANASRGYENSLYLIWELVLSRLHENKNLNTLEKELLIRKVLQKQSWDKVLQKLSHDISGKKQTLSILRKAVSKLLQS